MFKPIAVSCLFSVLAACASNKGPAGPGMDQLLRDDTGSNGRACVRIADINGYGYDKGVLTVDARSNYYLVTTVIRCNELNTAARVVFKGPQNEICGGGTSTIIAGGERCPIRGVFEYADRKSALAALEHAATKQDAASEGK